MIANGKMQELETVALTEDLPEYGLKRGEKGVVVETFDKPEEAYMLEFVDESGASSKMADWVKPEQIKPVREVAKEFLDQGFELLNKGDSAFTKLGIQAIEQEDFRTALVNFKWAFSAYSDETTKANLAKAYFNLAEACLTENSLEEAVGFFEEALLAGYVEPSLYNDYAIALARLRRVDDAVFALESGLAMEPDNAIIRENLRMANEASLNLQREFIEPQFEPIQTHEYQLAA